MPQPLLTRVHDARRDRRFALRIPVGILGTVKCTESTPIGSPLLRQNRRTMNCAETDVVCQSTKRGKPFIREQCLQNDAPTCGERAAQAPQFGPDLRRAKRRNDSSKPTLALTDRAEIWIVSRQKTMFGRVASTNLYRIA